VNSDVKLEVFLEMKIQVAVCYVLLPHSDMIGYQFLEDHAGSLFMLPLCWSVGCTVV